MTCRNLVAAAALVAVAGAAQAEGKLNVYNWGDYINPAVLDKFGEEYRRQGHARHLWLQRGDAGEDPGRRHRLRHRLPVGAHARHHVPARAPAETDIGQDPASRTSIRQFLRAKTDPEAKYCLPYAFGNVGIVYNKAKVRRDQVLGRLLRPRRKRREDLAPRRPARDDRRRPHHERHLGQLHRRGRDRGGGAGHPRPQAKDVSAFTYDIIPLVQSGDVAAAHWFVGANIYVKPDPDVLGYVIPEEGATHVPGGHLRPRERAEQGERQEVPAVLPAARDRRAERRRSR